MIVKRSKLFTIPNVAYFFTHLYWIDRLDHRSMAIADEEKESRHERITRFKRHFYVHLANYLLAYISLIFEKSDFRKQIIKNTH